MRYKFLLALLGLSLLFTACSAPGGPTAATPEVIPPVIAENTIIAEGRVEPIRYAEIAFNISGDVGEVPVKEGQSVKKGDILIRLGDESDTQYAAAQLKLASARKDLNDLLNASTENFAQVVIDLKQAKEDYDNAEQYLNYIRNSPKVPQTETFAYYLPNQEETQVRIRTRHFKGPAPESMITWAENDVAMKKAVVDKLQLTHDRMAESGVDRDELAVLEARLNAAEAGVAAFSITAPFDGVVADLSAKAGNSIKARETVVTVADFSSWLIETTDLTEIDVVNLAENQAVSVKLDAIPDVELQGTILSIGQTYAENQGDVVYKVTILLRDTHPAMRWGMTAEVKFESAE
ncbi:MAG TPA: HlyD family efflux transporter periplasmic adaptor subunit [Anaerolineales bacterium]|nr:HlyD family efflux transporter periplasmic adaptor subunit [Anaerolineales bacterium]